MNRNTSPSSRLSRRQSGNLRGHESQPKVSRKKRESATRAAAKVRDTTQARLDTRSLSMPARIRRALLTVAVADGMVFALIVAIALATVLLTASPAAWLPTIIATSWMVANGVAVQAGDITIGMVPLLPALILFGLVAKRINGAVKRNISVKGLIILIQSVLSVALIFNLIAWFMLWDAAKVYEVSPPVWWMSIAKTLTLHLLAVAAGMPARLWQALARRYAVKLWIVDGLLNAARYLWMNSAAAIVIVLLLFGAGWDKQHTLLAQYPSVPTLGLLSLILLSIAYIPNAVIGTISVLMGSDFHIGQASVSLFDTHLVPLPPLPIAAIIPAGSAAWAPILMVIPLACAFILFFKNPPTILQALSTGVWSGFYVLVLVWFSSGVLGIYGTTGSTAWLSALLALAWTAGTGLIFALARMITSARSHSNSTGTSYEPQEDSDVGGLEKTEMASETEPKPLSGDTLDLNSAAEADADDSPAEPARESEESEPEGLDPEGPDQEGLETEEPESKNPDPEVLKEEGDQPAVGDHPEAAEGYPVDGAGGSRKEEGFAGKNAEETVEFSSGAEETLKIIDGEIVEEENRAEK